MRGRTPKAQTSEPPALLKEKIGTALNTLASHCEEELEAGERISSPLQTVCHPSKRPGRTYL